MEEVRNRANLAVALLNHSHAVGKKIVGDAIASFDPLLQFAEVHRNRCEFLCDRVMQFPRDAAMFFVLHLEQTPGKLSQGLVGLLPVANIGQQPLNLHLRVIRG